MKLLPDRIPSVIASALLTVLLSGCGGDSAPVTTAVVTTLTPPTSAVPQPIDPSTVVRSGLKGPEEALPPSGLTEELEAETVPVAPPVPSAAPAARRSFLERLRFGSHRVEK